MRIEPEISAVSIVMRGSFNPAIFQPFWFAKQGLISEEAAASAKIEVIHPEISSFEIGPDFRINVQSDLFQIGRTVAPLVPICDLVSRIFGDILPHTPIGQIGINRAVHFNLGSMAERDRIGELLAPRAPWGEWGAHLGKGTGEKHGGLQSITLIDRDPGNREFGWIQVKLEPSNVVGKGQTGIFMEINDHYQLRDPTKATEAMPLISILQKRFDPSLQRSDELIDQIMSLKP